MNTNETEKKVTDLTEEKLETVNGGAPIDDIANLIVSIADDIVKNSDKQNKSYTLNNKTNITF